MQNTARIPTIPTTLIKNFFIAGVNQTTLTEKILDGKSYSIQPEVLFTMYSKMDRVSTYLQFVFPDNVAVEYKPLDPKFYTFMMTDSDGFNSFFHVLIFYEEINEAEINCQDFDIVTEILRKQHMSKKVTYKNGKGSPTPREGSHGENQEDQELFGNCKKKIVEQHNNRNRRKDTTKFVCLNAVELSKLNTTKLAQFLPTEESISVGKGKGQLDRKMKEHFEKQKEKAKKNKDMMEQMMQNIQNQAVCGGKANDLLAQSMNHGISQPLNHDQKGGLSVSIANKSWVKAKGPTAPHFAFADKVRDQQNYTNSQSSILQKKYSQRSNGEHLEGGLMGTQGNADRRQTTLESHSPTSSKNEEGSVSFGKAARFAMRNKQPIQSLEDYEQFYKPRLEKSGKTAGGNNEEPAMHFGSSVALPKGFAFKKHDGDEDESEGHSSSNQYLQKHKLSGGEQEFDGMLDEDDHEIQELYKKKLYVPVALVLETETEYHDVFRQILLQMFDQIRVPDTLYSQKPILNRLMAFADLIAHLAFLKTIPAPPFNSVYHIHCFNTLITIRESSFDQIPNKNQFPIRILFDVLDVRSIFYCWKAMLFDKSLILRVQLVLVSSQYSLQFYVAEGLKQLLFPMTWQNTYIQPGNESLAGHADGTMAVVYGSNNMINGFDFFDGLSSEMAVCDIDACYTNNIELPAIPDEQMFIRILNMLKNTKINQYDKAYPDSCEVDSDDFVQQVKETFFGMIKPYLQKIEDFIDTKVEASGAYFQKYFKVEEYLSHFESYSPCHHKFAQALVNSSQFIHFCDDFFSEELNNYQLLLEIFRSRGEIHTPTKEQMQKKRSYDPFFFDDASMLKKAKWGQPQWPDSEPVVFNFRMPQDNQRAMLFEKILYMIEDSMRRREEDITRRTNEHILMNKDNFKYESIIKEIRTLYPIKLKGIHKKYQMMENKITQQNYLRKLHMNSTVDLFHNMQSQIGAQGLALGGATKSTRKVPAPRFDSSDTLNVMVIETDAGLPGGDGTQLYEAERINMFGKEVSQNTAQKQNYTPYRPKDLDQSYFQTSNGGQNVGVPYMQNSMKPLHLNFQYQTSRIPLELLASLQEDFNGSQIYQNSLTNSLFEDEQRRVQNFSKRISKLMYGKEGLIAFLHHLFGLLTDNQKKNVNYYFSMKEQIEQMQDHMKKQQKNQQEKLLNKDIMEELEEEKSPTAAKKNASDSSFMVDSVKDLPQEPPKPPQKSKFAKKKEEKPAQPTQQQVNPTSSLKQQAMNSSVHSAQFKTDKDWFSIDKWEGQCCQIRKTQQFALFKIKILEAFECPEEAYSLIWKELIKFPVTKMKYFPRTKFMNIWENLTHSQQEELFSSMGKKQNKPCIQMISKDYMRSRSLGMKSTEGGSTSSSANLGFNKPIKSDETLFYGASVAKSYLQKKQEKREKELSMRKSKSSYDNGNPFAVAKSARANESPGSCSGSLSMLPTSKKPSILTSNQKSINDYIKSKLTLKLTQSAQSTPNHSKKGSSNDLKSHIAKNPPPLSSRSQVSEDPLLYDCSEKFSPLTKVEKVHQKSQFFQGNKCDSQDYKSNQTKKDDSMSIAVDYDLRSNAKRKETKISKMKEPEKISQRMLTKIISFWKKHAKHVTKRGTFVEAELKDIQEEMMKFEKYLTYCKTTLPDFDADEEVQKQVFFLNIFNFLVLYQLSVLMISTPEAIEKLTNYNMWQSFLVSTSLKIGCHKINAYAIMHSILRYALQQPQISQFMLNTPAIEFNCCKYQIKNPHKLLAYGFFLPLQSLPKLMIYESKNFGSQLRANAEEFLQSRIKIKEDFLFVQLPAFLKWYQSDFEGTYLIDILEFIHQKQDLVIAQMMYSVFHKKGPESLGKFIEKFNSSQINGHEVIVEYKSFSWEFDPLKLANYFPDTVASPSPSAIVQE